MADNSTVYFPPAMLFCIFTGSADHLLSVPLNCWALWLMASGKRSLIQSEILTLNLVIAEIAFSLCFFLMMLQSFLASFSIDPLINCYVAMAVMGRALFQCHMCVDRYVAVVHPVMFIRYKQIKYRGACLVALWLVVFSSGLSNIFNPQSPILLSISSITILAPSLSVELFCSLSIVRILRRPGPGDKDAQQKKEGNQQKTRAVRIICIMLVMLVFNVTPFMAVAPLNDVTSGDDLIAVAFTLSTVGSSVQAFLFLSRSGKLTCKNRS